MGSCDHPLVSVLIKIAGFLNAHHVVVSARWSDARSHRCIAMSAGLTQRVASRVGSPSLAAGLLLAVMFGSASSKHPRLDDIAPFCQCCLLLFAGTMLGIVAYLPAR